MAKAEKSDANEDAPMPPSSIDNVRDNDGQKDCPRASDAQGGLTGGTLVEEMSSMGADNDDRLEVMAVEGRDGGTMEKMMMTTDVTALKAEGSPSPPPLSEKRRRSLDGNVSPPKKIGIDQTLWGRTPQSPSKYQRCRTESRRSSPLEYEKNGRKADGSRRRLQECLSPLLP